MAVDLMDMLKGAVSQQVLGKMGESVGLEPKQTSSVFETIAATVLGGLMKQASSPEGAQTVFDEAQKQDGDILEKLGDILGGGEKMDELQTQGGGLLETILGGDSSNLMETLAKAFGLDKGIVGKLITMVAPIVLAVIGRHLKAKALDAVGLGKLLGEQKEHMNKYMPASLAGNLGFGNMLSDASEAVSKAADSVADAGRSAADAAGQGGSLLKSLFPLILLALVAWGIWKFVINQPPAEKLNDNNPVVAPADDVSQWGFSKLDLSDLGVEQAMTLKSGLSEIATGLKDASTKPEAKQLADKISEFSTQVESMNLHDVPEIAKGPLGQMIGGFRSQIETLIDNVPDMVKPIVRPAIDSLLEKLSGALQ